MWYRTAAHQHHSRRADACNGRIYLPTEDLERFGVVPADLIATGPPGDRLRALLACEAEAARLNTASKAGKSCSRPSRPWAGQFC